MLGGNLLDHEFTHDLHSGRLPRRPKSNSYRYCTLPELSVIWCVPQPSQLPHYYLNEGLRFVFVRVYAYEIIYRIYCKYLFINTNKMLIIQNLHNDLLTF